MKESERLVLKELKSRIKPLILRLKKEKGMKSEEIAYVLGKTKSVTEKYAQGKNFPVNNEVRNLVDIMENLLNPIDKVSPEDALLSEKRLTNEGSISYEFGSSLVSIFFEHDEKTETYKGEQGIIGTITKVKAKPAIIAYRNDSAHNRNADGLIYLEDAGLEPRIKYGSLVAIRKIDKQAWRPGYFYLVVDTSDQVFIRKLLAGKNDEEVRLVSEDESNYPDFTLSLSKIAAIFRIEKVTRDP